MSKSLRQKLRGKRLVDELMLLYPLFAETCKNESKLIAAIGTWTLAIKGLTEEEIQAALGWCANQELDFPPSIGRFRRKAKGIIDSDIAFQNALGKEKCTPLIEDAKARIGKSAFKNESESVLRRKFLSIYERLCEQVLDNTYNSPHNNLESPKSIEELQAYLDKILPVSDSLPNRVREYNKMQRGLVIEVNNERYTNWKQSIRDTQKT
jgi:hypothetical protein